MTTDREFDRLDSHLRSSWLVRAPEALARAWSHAANRSATARSLRIIQQRFLSLPGQGRVRAIATVVAAAALGHLLLLPFVPAHIAPALPKTFWVLVAATALGAAFDADRLSRAWQSSRVCRLLRRVVDLPC